MNKKLMVFALVGLLMSLSLVMAIKLNTDTSFAEGRWEKHMCKRTDISNDGMVGVYDAGMVKSSYGMDNCNWRNRWCNKADVSHSGTVNELDAQLVKAFYGC